MKANVLRWILAVLMLAVMAVTVASPALADTEFTHTLEGPDSPEVPLTPVTLDAGDVKPLELDQLV